MYTQGTYTIHDWKNLRRENVHRFSKEVLSKTKQAITFDRNKRKQRHINNKKMLKAHTAMMMIPMVMMLGVTEADRRSGYKGCRSCVPSGSNFGYANYQRRPFALDLITDALFSNPMDHWMSNIFSMPLHSNSLLYREDQLARMDRSAPRYSIDETDEGIELALEVPGIAAEDMAVEVVDGHTLSVRGTRTIRSQNKEEVILQSEFNQSFRLDKDIDVEKISATLKSGILRVSAKKQARMHAKKIPIIIQEQDDQKQFKIEEETAEKESAATGETEETETDTAKKEDDLVAAEEESWPASKE